MTDANFVARLPTLEVVISDIHRILDETGLSPDQLTVDKYSRAGGKFDGRMLRRLGGFQAIIDEAFHDMVAKDFVTNQYLARRRNYVNKLERKLGDGAHMRKSFEDSLKRVIDAAGAVKVSKLDKPKLPKKQKKARTNLAFISDIHLGLKIDRAEVSTNEYSWDIGAMRLGRYAEQVANYKIDHRDECDELRVCLGGDLGQGVIHPDYGTDPITYQCYGISTYLIQMIDYWRHYYNRVVVEFTPDNHMRMPHRGPERDWTQKIDNFSTFGIFLPLQAAFRTTPDVEFHASKSGISTFDVLGHKFAMTHGDTHIYSGNVGSAIDVRRISNQILKLNASVTDGRHYDVVLMGHVHTPLYMHLSESNTYLVINGTGSGTDGYAASKGFFRTTPTQVLMEVTPSYPVGDFRIVDLSEIKGESSNTIIEPYDYDLLLSKAASGD